MDGELSISISRLSKTSVDTKSFLTFHLTEAIEEFAKLCQRATIETLKEDLQIGLLHAYHDLNFAWNTRFLPMSAYGKMTDGQFKRWGRYPSSIERV